LCEPVRRRAARLSRRRDRGTRDPAGHRDRPRNAGKQARRASAAKARQHSAMKLLEGKTALITGVANRWSIATGIARAMHAHGARLCFIYQGERVKDEVEKLASELGGGPAWACDVTSDVDLRRLNDSIARELGRLDVLVHSIAFVNKEDL